jgi:hypothetical protein
LLDDEDIEDFEDKVQKRTRAWNKKIKEFIKDHPNFDQIQIEKDPLIIYGYGVVALFKLMRTLIICLLFISILIALPQILGYIWLPVDSIMDSTF